MKNRRKIISAAIFLAAVAVPVSYWILWKFHYSRRDIDPFATESTYDKGVRIAFGPIERFERARVRRLAIPEGRRFMQGHWEGAIYANEGFAKFFVKIDDDIITFAQAKSWPELHGKSFYVRTDEESWSLYFDTDLGRTIITSPSDSVRSGEQLDRIQIQAHVDGGWPDNSYYIWTMQRVPDKSSKANKSEMATPRKPSDQF